LWAVGVFSSWRPLIFFLFFSFLFSMDACQRAEGGRGQMWWKVVVRLVREVEVETCTQKECHSWIRKVTRTSTIAM
jgi:hypothetical protein